VPATVGCAKKNTVVFETTEGTFEVECFTDKAPGTCKNFFSYVDAGFYNGTIFHRVIPGFVIQGGGFTEDLQKKETQPPIKNEADNGLKNTRGTLSMARTNQVDSATSQFFVNLVDNKMLDHRGKDPRGFGYAVFAKVTKGMDVVDKIKDTETLCPSRPPQRGMPPQPCTAQLPRGMRDVPAKPIVVTKATRK
jgi:cyclophilin family peptidyl-prolyl cis-trans isomerase